MIVDLLVMPPGHDHWRRLHTINRPGWSSVEMTHELVEFLGSGARIKIVAVESSVSDRLAYVRSGLDDVRDRLDDLTRCGHCTACYEDGGECLDRLDVRSLAVEVEALRRTVGIVADSLRSAVVELSCSTVPRTPVNGERLDLWLVEQVAQIRAMHAAEVATMRTEFEARLATVERLTGVRFGA